ncbi:MAG: hypothetical protein CFE24_15055 [Flavobacterium sp. BFFFF2]|nr:MAG: hypothetical protein CFE24_15055 [Flavobacterium sp. BFFFF2]
MFVKNEFSELFSIIESKAKYQVIDGFPEKYPLLIDKGILDNKPISQNVEVSFDSDYKLIETNERFDLEYWKYFNVKWTYTETSDSISKLLTFRFLVIGYLRQYNVDGNYAIDIEVLDPIKLQLKFYQDLKIKTFKRHNILNLNKYSSSYTTDIFNKCMDVCFSKKPKFTGFQPFHYITDLTNISEDIVLQLSELILFKNYTQDFLQNPTWHYDTIIFPYNHSFYDKRFYYLVGTIASHIFSFCDRLGNLLFNYFELNLTERNVNFSSTLANFPFKTNDNYIWLIQFKDNEYQKLKAERHQVVHYYLSESKMFNELIANISNEGKLRMLQDEKLSYPEYFMNLYNTALLAFEKTLKLVEECGENQVVETILPEQ